MVIPFLGNAYDMNEKNDLTLYNLGYVLYKFGEIEMARGYACEIKEKNSKVLKLLSDLQINKDE
jgi:hypothetical protein